MRPIWPSPGWPARSWCRTLTMSLSTSGDERASIGVHLLEESVLSFLTHGRTSWIARRGRGQRGPRGRATPRSASIAPMD
jgi:hypothetical protein